MQESIDETSKSEYDVKLKTDFGGLAMLAYKDRSKEELLESLEFGSVDSESEENLDDKFIKTRDFNEGNLLQHSWILRWG